MGPVVRRSDSAIHRIVRIFSTFVKCLKNCETTDTDEPNAIKTKKQQKNFILMRIVLNPSLLSYFKLIASLIMGVIHAWFIAGVVFF